MTRGVIKILRLNTITNEEKLQLQGGHRHKEEILIGGAEQLKNKLIKIVNWRIICINSISSFINEHLEDLIKGEINLMRFNYFYKCFSAKVQLYIRKSYKWY